MPHRAMQSSRGAAYGPRMVRRPVPLSVKVILFSLITCWSILSAASYEVWSIYFDDTRPSLSEAFPLQSLSAKGHTRRQLFEVPFSQTRYMFELATFINASNERQIRRMELSLCDPVVNSLVRKLPSGSWVVNPTDGATYACVQRIASQTAPIALNRTIVQYPQGVGLSLGGTGASARLLLLAVEYSADPVLLQDNSGFDLYLSDEPVSLEAGVMAVGLVPDHRFFVPPNVSEWSTTGTCHSSCFDYKMEHDEFAVAAIFPSASHRSLGELTLEVAAPDSTSRKIFAWGGDTSVDMSHEPLIKTTDKLVVRCSFGETSRSLMGGLGEDNENCLVWLHYYPKMDLDACLSSYSAATIMSLLGADQLNATITDNTGLNLEIQGTQLAEFVEAKDQAASWDMKQLAKSRYSLSNGRQIVQCGWKWGSIVPELRRR